jgi:branched-chain amino acid transport system substrate-binding protein
MAKAITRTLMGASIGFLALFAMPAAQGQGDQPVKVGVLLGFTGPAAQGAASYIEGVRLAVKELNDSGGLLGRRVEVIEADTGLDPARAVSEARRLVQQQKIEVAVGPEASGLAIAVAPIFNEAKVPYFTPTVTAAPTRYNFSSMMSGVTQATAMLNFAAKHLNAKTVAVLADNGSVGKALTEDVKKLAPGMGLTVVALQEYDIRSPDLTPQLLSLRRANPDVILNSGSVPPDAGTLINNLKDLGWNPKILSTMFAQAPTQVMQVSGPDSFKSGSYWGLIPTALTYCAQEKMGDRAYDHYLSRLKAFDPAAFDKLDYKGSLYFYDLIFIYRAAVQATKSFDGADIVNWIEQNGSKLRTAGAGYPVSVNATSHFMQGPDSVTFVQRPDLVRAADKLVERGVDCPS